MSDLELGRLVREGKGNEPLMEGVYASPPYCHCRISINSNPDVEELTAAEAYTIIEGIEYYMRSGGRDWERTAAFNALNAVTLREEAHVLVYPFGPPGNNDTRWPISLDPAETS